MPRLVVIGHGCRFTEHRPTPDTADPELRSIWRALRSGQCEPGARQVAGRGARSGRSLAGAASPHFSLTAASALTRWTNV
jgi:hypothetical protein